MATTYRAMANADDFRKAGAMLPSRKVSAPRDSKALRRAAFDAFRELLAAELPMGPKASAHLECSGKYGLEIVARAAGFVTGTREALMNHCRVPSRGRWDVVDGNGKALFSVIVGVL